MHFLIIFGIIVIVKLFLNLFRLIETYVLFWIFNKHPKNISQCCPFVTSLFNSAGTQKTILVTSRIGGINQASKDYISNSLDDSSSYAELQSIFQKTIGVYKFRILQSLNPFYWIFLPKYLLEGVGIFLPGIVQFLLNLVYWFLGSAGSYLLEKYFDLHYLDFFQHIVDMLPK